MSKAMQLVGIILLGIFTLAIIYLMSDARSTNELDYYLLQEVTEASMYDAVDYSYYRLTGLLKVDRDMFLESFNRRFAQSVAANRDYDIRILDFNETPPKVSVEVTTSTVASVKGEVALITNSVNGVIETIYDDLVMSRDDLDYNNLDNTKPTIKVEVDANDKEKYNITFEDEGYVGEYSLIPFNDDRIKNAEKKGKIKIESCGQLYNYLKLKDWTEFVYYETVQTITVQPNHINQYIFVKDRAGNYACRPLDYPPKLSPWREDNKVSFTAYDDNGIEGYAFATGKPATLTNVIAENQPYNPSQEEWKDFHWYITKSNIPLTSDANRIYIEDAFGNSVTSNSYQYTTPPSVADDSKNRKIKFKKGGATLDSFAVTPLGSSRPTSWKPFTDDEKKKDSVSRKYADITSADGTYLFWVKDNQNNSNILQNKEIKVDTTPPKFTVNNKSLQVVAKREKDGSDLTHYAITNSSAIPSVWSEMTSSYNAETKTFLYSECPWEYETCYFWVKDKRGHVVSQDVVVRKKLLDTPTTLVMNQGKKTPWKVTSVNLKDFNYIYVFYEQETGFNLTDGILKSKVTGDHKCRQSVKFKITDTSKDPEKNSYTDMFYVDSKKDGTKCSNITNKTSDYTPFHEDYIPIDISDIKDKRDLSIVYKNNLESGTYSVGVKVSSIILSKTMY